MPVYYLTIWHPGHLIGAFLPDFQALVLICKGWLPSLMPCDVAMPTILLLDNLTFPAHSCNHQNSVLPNICYIEYAHSLLVYFSLSPLLSEYFIFSDLVITNVLLQAFPSFPSQCQTVTVCTFADFQPFAVFLICSVLKSLFSSVFI